MKMDKLKEAYEVLREEELTDVHSRGTILRHKKTGARVMLIENEDENKVFNIVFRTPPSNSTGVAHILEHSVLCGSREFPLKDPFVELVKGSMNTFLNAMTYPDKTCYPVASCNDQDFQNLMHVYLDAVFHPNIYEHEEIFLQEGWHYHLEQPEGPLTLNGVVYNEMKGAFSSSDEVLDRTIVQSLFPDTTYGVESGGDPDYIPDLTYEEFLNTHRRFYHPSNSFIYLYGKMDMEEKLLFLHEKYLSDYDELKVNSEITCQKPFEALQEITMPYPVSEEEGEEENTYFSYNMVIGDKDPLICTAFEIIEYALLGSPGAPLKKALQEAGIGKEIYGDFDDGILQPYFSIVAKGAKPEEKERFLAIIRQVLWETVQKGLDKKAITAGLNSMEFRYREADYSSYPKGLIYGLDILDDWLYSDEDPFVHLKQVKVFEELRRKMDTDFFERLIDQYLLNNTNGSIVTLEPKAGLAAEKEAKLAASLEAYRESLSREELETMAAKTKTLEAYQDAPEDPKLLKCIPMLERSDIRREIIPLSNAPYRLENTLFLHHPVLSNGIGYLELLFDVTDLSLEKIHYLGLLKSLLGYMDTEHYSYGELFNEINANSGGFSCGVQIFERDDYEDGFRPMFAVRGKALYSQMEFLFGMIREVLLTTKLSDKSRLREIVSEVKSRAQGSLVSGGHGTAVLRATSYSSKGACFQDEMAGVGYYQFLEHLDKHFEEEIDRVIAGVQEVLGEILLPENLSVDYTGEESSLEQLQRLVRELREALPGSAQPTALRELICRKKNEGFKTASQVQYVAQTGNFRNQGLEYTGALSILKLILSYEYLWNNIRVKGGAYGCMSGFKRTGESFFASYRDPHLKKTLETFAGVPDFIRSFHGDEREMTKYIIGTIGSRDIPRTPQMQGSISKAAYFDGVTEEQLQKERDQILDATEEDIQALAPIVEAVLAEQQICVVGSESAVEKSKDVFIEVKSLIH